jgi:glycolate oxidase FAD binding subunit
VPLLEPSTVEALRSVAGPNAVTEPSTGPLRIAPADTDAVSRVLAFASSRNLSIAPTGGGTKLHWGNPVSADLLLDTRRLSGIREHVWQDLTCTVGAGTTWADLQQLLAQHGQRVALDTIHPDTATVGGVLSSNDSGLLRLRYGSLRDLVLGATIVLSDGTIARSGGKVVKNVAGYDLPKLLIGSFGTLGVITEVSFRLHPVQQHAKSVTVRALDIAVLTELMKQVLAQSLSIERMQLRNESTSFALDIELASSPEVIAEHESKLSALTGELIMETAAPAVWSERENLFANPADTVVRITTLPAKLAALTAGFAQLSQYPDHSFRAVTDPAGILTVACSAPADSLTQVITEIRERLRSSSGHCVVLNRGALAAEIDPWGGVPQAIEVMRSIKQQFDPTRTLNPGKFVGGL